MRYYVISMILVAAGVALIAYSIDREYKETVLSDITMNLAENNAEYTDIIESEIRNIRLLVESHSKALSMGGRPASSELAEVLDTVREREGAITSMYFLYDSDGTGVNASGYMDAEEIGVELRMRPWYRDAVAAEKTIITDVYQDARRDALVVTIACAVRSGGKLQGVLAADLFLGSFYEAFRELTTWRTTYNYVLDSAGAVVLHPDEKMLGMSFRDIEEQQIRHIGLSSEDHARTLSKIWREDFSVQDRGVVEYVNQNKTKVRAVFEHIPESGWTVVSASEYSAYADTVRGYTLRVGILSAFAIGVFGAVLYYFLVWSDAADPVTRTGNTNKLISLIGNRPDRGEGLVALFIDVKNLSHINFRYGMDGGDRVLYKYGRILRNLLKDHGQLTTTKDRHFIFLFDSPSWTEAEEFTRSLAKRLENLPVTVGEEKVLLNSFLGLTALSFQEGKEIEPELELMEDVFTEFKKAGVDSPLIFRDFNALADKEKAEIRMKEDLLKAIEEDRLVPFFQPIINMRTGETEKFEVLMRVRKGDGFLAPYPYIVAAEKYGIIDAVDLQVIRKALDYKCSVDKEDTVKLSMNISGKSLRDGAFIEKVLEKVDALGIRHSNITFEITESTNIEEMNKVIELVRKYRERGVQFSIDDFGSGFSSMYYMKHIPADYLKIDGSFIRDIHTNTESYHIVESIISMAKAFHMKTVAEFVENSEIQSVLEGLDVDFGQGYHFGKPQETFTS